MRGRFRPRGSKRSEAVERHFGALGKVRERLGRQETRRVRTPYGGALGLGIGALAVVAMISLVLLLRRRAANQGSSLDEVVNEEVENEEA
jgi:hypothetical protein